jgi:hypothetical protein
MTHHFPDEYYGTLQHFVGELAGTLVLVGAGIFGKACCGAADSHYVESLVGFYR